MIDDDMSEPWMDLMNCLGFEADDVCMSWDGTDRPVLIHCVNLRASEGFYSAVYLIVCCNPLNCKSAICD
jgi:hypothetical protein